ncbi:MAG: LytTR family transcriptional regulator [Clostridiales bacterium]|nr:LytTR family transcriptional regulator [Clostridiales bacterium]
MKLFLKKCPGISEPEVEIRYSERTEAIDNLVRAVNQSSDTIFGIKENGDREMIYITGILYFEAVDRDVFAYRAQGVYRVRSTLYELEEELRDRFFVRISKSVIVNIKAVSSISPEDSRRVKLRLNNGEYLIVSRGYVSDFREAIGMKGGRSK